MAFLQPGALARLSGALNELVFAAGAGTLDGARLQSELARIAAEIGFPNSPGILPALAALVAAGVTITPASLDAKVEQAVTQQGPAEVAVPVEGPLGTRQPEDPMLAGPTPVPAVVGGEEDVDPGTGLPFGMGLDEFRDAAELESQRGEEFERFLATNEPFGRTTPFAQRTVRRRFDPMRAQYTLGGAAAQIGPEGFGNFPQDFRSFLRSSVPGLPGGFDWSSMFDRVRPLFTPDFGFQAIEGEDPEVAFARRGGRSGAAKSLEKGAENIILQSIMSGVSPQFRKWLPQFVQRRVRAFEDANPNVGTLAGFLGGQF